MKKTTITLFSISTIFAVLIIAVAILLVSNYTKNSNSGINLEPQVIQSGIYLNNQTDTAMAWVLSDASDVDKDVFQALDTSILSEKIILAVMGLEKSTGGFTFQLDNVRLRGQKVTINYQIINPPDGSQVTLAATYPSGVFTINKDKLPVGVPLEFIFHNKTDESEVIINKTITL